MKCDSNTRWKYLRENKSKYFDETRNTSLDEYLAEIFPDVKFKYNSSISSEDLVEGVKYRRFKCDAISRELNLVVEFDGLNHYMDSQVVLNDIERDDWFHQLGYKVVRIPYWIQLSKHVIQELFDVEVNSEFCELKYNFYNPEKQTVNLNILPGNMCELGRRRFIAEFNKFSDMVKVDIFNDLFICLLNIDIKLVPFALPKYVFDLLNLEYVKFKHYTTYQKFIYMYE